MKRENWEAYEEILSKLQADSRVQEMKQYIQHGNVTTYDHCLSVARLAYRLSRALHMKINLKTLATGAMLHDFYLYDWHLKGDGTHRLHGFSHAGRAARNARACFNVDDATRHVIYSHMWPLNPERVPMSREAWLVCLADKLVSIRETLVRT